MKKFPFLFLIFCFLLIHIQQVENLTVTSNLQSKYEGEKVQASLDKRFRKFNREFNNFRDKIFVNTEVEIKNLQESDRKSEVKLANLEVQLSWALAEIRAMKSKQNGGCCEEVGQLRKDVTYANLKINNNLKSINENSLKISLHDKNILENKDGIFKSKNFEAGLAKQVREISGKVLEHSQNILGTSNEVQELSGKVQDNTLGVNGLNKKLEDVNKNVLDNSKKIHDLPQSSGKILEFGVKLQNVDKIVRDNFKAIQRNSEDVKNNKLQIKNNSEKFRELSVKDQEKSWKLDDQSKKIEELVKNVMKNSEKIGINAKIIQETIAKTEENLGKIQQNSVKIEMNDKKIEKNYAELERVSENVGKNGKKITHNSRKITHNYKSNQENSKKIENSNQKLNETVNSISKNKVMIEGISKKVENSAQKIDQNAAKIDSNAENIKENQQKIVNQSEIVKNSSTSVAISSEAEKLRLENLVKIIKNQIQNAQNINSSNNIQKLSTQTFWEPEVGQETLPLTYSWKIEQASEKLGNLSTEVESPWFSLTGYPLQAQARLFFKDSPSDVHVALSFKDPGEPLSSFYPFPQVTYVLRDQSGSGVDRVMSSTALFDGPEMSFEEKVLDGFLSFKPLLLSTPFLKDDTIVLDVYVETPSMARLNHSLDGQLLGRIDRFEERRASKRMVGLFSSPYFYTRPDGYRAQVQFVFGHHQRLLPGLLFLTTDHDPVLPSVFPHKTTITFLDANHFTHHLMGYKVADLNDVTEYDLPYVTHEELQGLMHNDYLYYHIQIEAL